MLLLVAVATISNCAKSPDAAVVIPPSVKITSISPTTSVTAGGATLIIQGALFNSGLNITVGNAACTAVNLVSSNEVRCILPALTTSTVGVSVFNTDGTSATLTNAIVYANSFGPPVVSSVNPTSGSTSGGTSVSIAGSQFQSGAGVLFDTNLCGSVNVVSASSITCVTPAHAANAVNVRVTNPDAQIGNLGAGYSYVTPPTYTSLKADVLTSRCLSCHGSSGGFSTEFYSQIITRVSVGNPAGSLLYQRVANDSMPTSGGPLTAAQKQKIFDWIADGAPNN